MNTKILKQYLIKEYKFDYVYIKDYTIDGAICNVTFYTDAYHTYELSYNINIWNMLLFLNTN